MTTVACVWVGGHVRYDVRYVERLARMVAAQLAPPYRFVCLTDRPALLERRGLEAIKIPNPRPAYAWWAKLTLFTPGIFDGDRVLYLDLDTLVVGPLAPIVTFPASFALVPDAGRFTGIGPRKTVKRFNSSVMVFDGGTLGPLWWKWSPYVAERLWGDQDWIGERCPDAATFPAAWCPRISQCQAVSPIPAGHARVVLCKVPKNHIAARRWPWVREVWEAA